MARYRKIDTRIWNDSKFRGLSDDAKLLFFFILTHPFMTSLGAMRATKAGLGAEIKWTPQRFRSAFQQLVTQEMIEFEEPSSFLAVPRFLRYNPPENPNVIKSWAHVLDLLPECDCRRQLFQRTVDFAKGLPAPFAHALPDTLLKGYAVPSRKGMPTPDPEPLPEPEPSSSLLRSLSPEQSPPNGDQDANGSESGKYQKFWGPVEKYIRSQIVAEIFQREYAGIRIVNMTGEAVYLAVQESLIEHYGEHTAERLTELIERADEKFLRDRRLEVQSIESLVKKALG